MNDEAKFKLEMAGRRILAKMREQDEQCRALENWSRKVRARNRLMRRDLLKKIPALRKEV